MARDFVFEGKSYPVAFTLAAMDAIEKLDGKPLDGGRLPKLVADRRMLIGMLAAMIDAAADAPTGLTAELLSRRLYPRQLPEIQTLVVDAITEGMTMQTDEADPDEEVDVTLEEIKKKEPADS